MVNFLDLDELKQTLGLDLIDVCEVTEVDGIKQLQLFRRDVKEQSPVHVYWEPVTGALSLSLSQLIKHKDTHEHCACSYEEIDEGSLQAFNQIRDTVLNRYP